MGEFVTLETPAEYPGIGIIRLSRPPMNALNVAVQQELHAAATEAAGRDEVRALIVYGGATVFAAGADIKEMADEGYPEMAARAGAISDALNAVARIPKPVVAAITGYALGGGCELALACDFRIAAPDAKLGQPEIRIGVIPGAGGTQRLPRLVGPSRAKELIFTGRHVGAAEAERIGLVDRVAEDPFAAAVEFVQPFVTGPAQAIRAAKQAIDGGLGLDLHSGLALETHLFAALFGTEDKTIGMRAFLAKQRPEFGGR